MKYLLTLENSGLRTTFTLGFLVALVIITSSFSMVDAHPHATPDLMESHSHDPESENFHEEFILHSFEHVIISTWEFFRTLIFG
ncbi:MAG TPA: hypothetical protein VD731_02285 [Nitrosopumilaceae archaeon]|nr:hypothetical protein [Nitrosopumilaceae archaeon]